MVVPQDLQQSWHPDRPPHKLLHAVSFQMDCHQRTNVMCPRASRIMSCSAQSACAQNAPTFTSGAARLVGRVQGTKSTAPVRA